MELNVFHVDQTCARVISKRMPVTGAIPAVAGDFIRLPDPACCENNRFALENSERPALAVIAESPNNAIAILQQSDNASLHVNIDAAMNAMILQRADHFQTGAIADVCQSRI